MPPSHPTLEVLELIGKIVGFVGAGIFFGYRAWVGFFNINCSLSLRCERSPKDAHDDWLALALVIEKGETAAMTLECVAARFRAGAKDTVAILETGRVRPFCSQTTSALSDWDPDSSHPCLYLSPKDRLELGCIAVVPKGEPCQVDVIVHGRKRRGSGFHAQWRSSAVSLPLPQRS